MKTLSTKHARQILFATDLTERSIAAWHRAVLLARQTGAHLTLLHVVESNQPERIARMQTNRAYFELLSQAERAFANEGIPVDIVVRRGGVRQIIARTAEELNADLIVVGAPRSRRLDSIVGTTAERLVRSARRAVLIVRREAADVYRNAVIATDLSDASPSMIRTAVQLAALGEATATVIHAHHLPYDGMMRSVGVEEAKILDYELSARQDSKRRLLNMSDEAGLSNVRARVVVRPEPAAVSIGRVLELERPELLVIGASRWFLLKRLLIGSVADRLLRAARCDVLIVPHRPAVLKLGSKLAASAGRGAVPARRSVSALARSVPIQPGLHEHDRGDRSARSYE